MRLATKIFAHLLYALGLAIIVLLSHGRYDWMRDMDPTTGTVPVDEGSGGRMIFSFLLLAVITASQLVIAMTAPGRIEKIVSLILILAAFVVWKTPWQ